MPDFKLINPTCHKTEYDWRYNLKFYQQTYRATREEPNNQSETRLSYAVLRRRGIGTMGRWRREGLRVKALKQLHYFVSWHPQLRFDQRAPSLQDNDRFKTQLSGWRGNLTLIVNLL